MDNEGNLRELNIEANKLRLLLNEPHKTLTLSKKFKQLLKFLGPSFIVSVAYIDPGNFATNISGGSVFNYSLIWVVLWSNIIAIFLQTMSAKLGIATNQNLSEMCRTCFSLKTNWLLWIIAEFAAMATTMAEFLGGTLGIYLLFGIPIKYAGIITCLVTLLIVYLQKYGQRIVEIIITILVAVISVSYALEVFMSKPNWTSVALHTLVPALPNGQAVLIAVGMLGATVMPHVIYLHSELVQDRNLGMSIEEKKRHFKLEKIDVTIAMNIAFIVNASMIIVSAAVFYSKGLTVNSIEQAHHSLTPLLGSLSSGAFGIALLASGFSSSAVGAMAGETVMDGFVDIKIPLTIKRIVTMLPAMVIIFLGINPMSALVISQVCLSFALPAAIIPLMIITSKKALMGDFTNNKFTKYTGWFIAALIIGLNIILLYLILTGSV